MRKTNFILRGVLYFLIVSLISCSCTRKNDDFEKIGTLETKPGKNNRKVTKAIFYLENSGSMFGYVNGSTEYVDVVSDLAENPKFVEQKTPREFNFINGGENISVTKIGDNPSTLKNKLNVDGYNVGDVSKSNLNAMFQLALSRAKNDTISILISDGIYDVGNQQTPENALVIEGRSTRSRFVERLSDGDLQTIIIKLTSQFDGWYYPVKGGKVKLFQERPYYIWIFGESELLNEYFSEEYIKGLKNVEDFARFLRFNNVKLPYQATTHQKVGTFQFGKGNKNKLISVKPDRTGKGFQLTIATDFSNLPFSETYFNSLENYSIKGGDYSIKGIEPAGNITLHEVPFKISHLISVYTENSPWTSLKISLLNKVPLWIEETNSKGEEDILTNSSQTFGFKFLSDAIMQAYEYMTKEIEVVTFEIELTK